MLLTEKGKSHINELAAQVEARTGVQILTVVAGKSDAYPEVPWKAFALGTSFAALAVVLAVYIRPGSDPLPPFLSGAVVLGAGMVLALSGVFLQPVSRCFLSQERVACETRQFAQSLFLERGLSRTQSRNALLILASRFERRAAVVADIGVIDRVPRAELEKLSRAMDSALARGSAPAALADALSALEELLLRHGFAASSGGDEIADEILETEGPRS
jgi:putative membrane protein